MRGNVGDIDPGFSRPVELGHEFDHETGQDILCMVPSSEMTLNIHALMQDPDHNDRATPGTPEIQAVTANK